MIPHSYRPTNDTASIHPARGFSLVELLVVIAIISALMAMLMPSLEQALENARYSRWLSFSMTRRVDESLVAYYPFEEKDGTVLHNMALTADTRVNPAELDGKFLKVNSAWTHPEWTSGRWKPKGGLFFAGSNCGIDCGQSRAWRIRDAITIEASFQTLQYRPGTAQQWIIGWGVCSGTRLSGWNLMNDGRYLWKSFLYNGTAAGGSNWSIAEAPFDWVHVAVTWDGKSICFYNNGVRVRGPLAWTGPINTDFETNCKIGLLQWSNDGYFNGIIDEIAVYNRALSEDEVKSHYEMCRVR